MRTRTILLIIFAELSILLIPIKPSIHLLESPVFAQDRNTQLHKAKKLLFQGYSQYYSGQLLLATGSFENALSIYQELKDEQSVKKILSQLLEIYTTLGLKDKIEAAYAKKRHLLADSEDVYAYAMILKNLERDDEAVGLLKDLLKRNQQKDNILGEAFSLNELGKIYLELQNLDISASYFKRSLDLVNKTLESNLLDQDIATGLQYYRLQALSYLSDVYYQGKNYYRSLEVSREMESISRNLATKDNGLEEGNALLKASRTLIDLANYTEAIVSLRKILEITEIENIELRSQALAFLGIAYFKVEQIKEAEIALSESMKLIEALRRPNVSEIEYQGIEVLPGLVPEETILYGSNYLEKLQIFEAQGLISQVLQEVLNLQKKPGRALEISEWGRSRVLLEQLHLKEMLLASSSIESQIQILDLKEKIEEIDNQIKILGKEKRAIRSESIDLTLEMARQQGLYTEKFVLSQADSSSLLSSERQRAFLEWMERREEASDNLRKVMERLDKRNEELKDRERQLEKQIQELSHQKMKLSSQKDELSFMIQEKLREFRLKDKIFIGIPDLQRLREIAKSQGATLVEYSIISSHQFGQLHSLLMSNAKNINWQGDQKEIFIWVVKPTGEVAFRKTNLHVSGKPLPNSSSVINRPDSEQPRLMQLIARTRDAMGITPASYGEVSSLRFRPDPIDMDDQLKQLHQLLIAPIADLLPSDPNQPVIFIPQGSLFFAPFPALLDDNGKYLIERHTVLTAPSIQALELTRQHKSIISPGKQILVVGNPKMPKNLVSLPNAEVEANTIATLFNTQPLIGVNATKATVMQRMPQARIIHLATHGLLDNVRGLGSSIVFTPSGQDDGLLTAEEILDMKLNADLVVLSACNTGRGRLTGDGVIGLSRSLIVAGVPSILVSLWSVPDNSTSTLMIEFYQNLQKQSNKAQALRNAMLTMIESGHSPFDWAGFTLIGEAK